MRFFNSSRSIRSVLSRNNKIEKEFFAKYGNKYQVVCDYYRGYKDQIEVVDISNILPELSKIENK